MDYYPTNNTNGINEYLTNLTAGNEVHTQYLTADNDFYYKGILQSPTGASVLQFMSGGVGTIYNGNQYIISAYISILGASNTRQTGGIASVTYPSTGTTILTFTTAFSQLPYIILTPETFAGPYSMRVSNYSTTGCQIQVLDASDNTLQNSNYFIYIIGQI